MGRKIRTIYKSRNFFRRLAKILFNSKQSESTRVEIFLGV